MFRLIKLAVFAMLGYALYEFARGLLSDGLAFPVGRQNDLNRALNRNEGRMQTLTAEGRGQREATLDQTGMSIPHQVGRGVVAK
jgi:hypothetical protein